MKLILLCVTVALVGCTRTFVKEDGSPLSARDKQECEYEALKSTGSGGTYFSLTKPGTMGQGATIEEKCLELRGYRVTYK